MLILRSISILACLMPVPRPLVASWLMGMKLDIIYWGRAPRRSHLLSKHPFILEIIHFHSRPIPPTNFLWANQCQMYGGTAAMEPNAEPARALHA